MAYGLREMAAAVINNNSLYKTPCRLVKQTIYYILLALAIYITSCSVPGKVKQTESVTYLESLLDPGFLNIPYSQFENSKYRITIAIGNPYSCISKFIFISQNKKDQWSATSYRHHLCDHDTALIEKINIPLGHTWDSVFTLIRQENLGSLPDPMEEIKKIQLTNPGETYFTASQDDIGYRFTFSQHKRSRNIYMNNVEAYQEWFKEHHANTTALDKCIRLKYLLGLVFDFDTDFRFEK